MANMSRPGDSTMGMFAYFEDILKKEPNMSVAMRAKRQSRGPAGIADIGDHKASLDKLRENERLGINGDTPEDIKAEAKFLEKEQKEKDLDPVLMRDEMAEAARQQDEREREWDRVDGGGNNAHEDREDEANEKKGLGDMDFYGKQAEKDARATGGSEGSARSATADMQVRKRDKEAFLKQGLNAKGGQILKTPPKPNESFHENTSVDPKYYEYQEKKRKKKMMDDLNKTMNNIAK